MMKWIWILLMFYGNHQAFGGFSACVGNMDYCRGLGLSCSGSLCACCPSGGTLESCPGGDVNACTCTIRQTCSHIYKWIIQEWSVCSSTCGNAQQTRLVECQNERDEIVSSYLCPTLKPSTIQSCTLPVCPINGGWSVWSTCSLTCGRDGITTRYCNNPVPSDDGAACSGPSITTCNTNVTCPLTPNTDAVTGNTLPITIEIYVVLICGTLFICLLLIWCYLSKRGEKTSTKLGTTPPTELHHMSDKSNIDINSNVNYNLIPSI